MSFLQNNSATVAARLTKKGRNSIANGDFNIEYFAVGDSEYNYSGSTQITFAPFDKDINVKYPLWFTTSGSTFYGIPVSAAITTPCSNVVDSDTGWTVNVVWDRKPTGVSGTVGINDYDSSKYRGIKQFLGYTDSRGQLTNTGTTIVNTTSSEVRITPEEQKCIALVHYSKSGTTLDPYAFFKYDDYISTSTEPTYPNLISDNEYFSVTIPNLMYHRSSSATTGVTFYMSSGATKQIVSNYNSKSVLYYKDLVDSSGATQNKVGKIFFNQKTIVFDDEEIVATLDTDSKRSYTLEAPLVSGVVSTNNPITDLTTGRTMWVTYMMGNDSTGTLPCNYYGKVSGTTNSQNVIVRFNGGQFKHLNNGYSANKFYILYQITNNSICGSELPLSTAWKIMDFTNESGLGGNINNLKTGHTFTINQSNYTGGTSFNLSTYTSDDYNTVKFGTPDNTTFPGSITAVRTTDIEQMVFNVPLPTDKFKTSQNPTRYSGCTQTEITSDVYITEVALLNSNKDALAVGKLSTPTKREGSQVISVKIDF